jgi:hypothetical protein
MVNVCYDWCSPVFSLYDIYHFGSGSTVFTEGSSITWKNTSGGSTAFLVTALASSSASVFFVLSICLTIYTLK